MYNLTTLKVYNFRMTNEEIKPQAQQGQQGEDKQKEAKKFQANMKTLTAIMKGSVTPKKRVDNDELSDIVDSIIADEKIELAKKVKDKLTSIIKAKTELEKQLAEKRAELDRLSEEKYKEFNKAVNDLFSSVESLNKIEASYYATMTEIAGVAEKSSEKEETKGE